MEAGLRTFSNRNLGPPLSLGDDNLTVRYTARNGDVGCLQATMRVPLWLTVDYYEVAVADQGEHCNLSIGFASPKLELNKGAGNWSGGNSSSWGPNSYCYHGEDGMVYHSSGSMAYGPPYRAGDTVGAGFNHVTCEIFFTKNGKSMGAAFRGVTGVLIPTVSLHSVGEVKANFGQLDFQYGRIETLRKAQKLPREFSTCNVLGWLVVTADKRTVKHAGSRGDVVGTIQADRPVTVPGGQASYYYEVKVKDDGLQGYIGIGFASPNYSQNMQPGWAPTSYGYHGDNGKAYHSKPDMPSMYVSKAYGPTFTTGDTLGAGINYSAGTIYFTKNGRYLGTAFRGVKGSLLPTVGLQSPGAKIEANFGDLPFVFDGNGLQMAEEEPAKFSGRNVGRWISMSPDNLIIRYLGVNGDAAAAVQADQLVPMWRRVYYYEIKVKNKRRYSNIGVGFARPDFPPDKQPGRTEDSYGYHGYNGEVYCNSLGVPYGPVFGMGDVIGAGFNRATREIFFTRNGIYLGVAFTDVEGDLIPTVGLHGEGEAVKANFGQLPFGFVAQTLEISEPSSGPRRAVETNSQRMTTVSLDGAAPSASTSSGRNATPPLQEARAGLAEYNASKQLRRPVVTLSLCGHAHGELSGLLYGAVGQCFCGANFSESEMRAFKVDPGQIEANILARAPPSTSQRSSPLANVICPHCKIVFQKQTDPLRCLPFPFGCGQLFPGSSSSSRRDSITSLAVSTGGIVSVRDDAPSHVASSTPQVIPECGRPSDSGPSDVSPSAGSSDHNVLAVSSSGSGCSDMGSSIISPSGGGLDDTSQAPLVTISARKCVVCMDKVKDAVFIPCGHVSCCIACALRCSTANNPLCPVCRAIVKSTHRIYL